MAEAPACEAGEVGSNPTYLIEQIKEVVVNSQERWEKGMAHHPKSVEVYEFIAKHDFENCGDFFDWKCGGDGDNGEELMYLLDEYFEQRDKKAYKRRYEENDD